MRLKNFNGETKMKNELIEVEEKSVLAAFVAGDGLDPIIAQARKLVDEFEPDLSTDKGRKAIASMAAKVAKLKVKLDDLGKDLVGDWKAKAKIVDGSRKKMRDELDELKARARAPLTEWENKEADRVKAHKEVVNRIDQLGTGTSYNGGQLYLDELKANLRLLNDVDISSLDEFELEAIKKKQRAIEALNLRIAAEQNRLDTEAELERMRAAEAEREQKEREEKIRQEAANKEREKLLEEQKEKTASIEKSKREGIAREEAAKKAAEESDRQRNAAEERAKVEAENAEKNRIAAEQKAKDDAEIAAENARQIEINRQKEVENQERIDKEKREADRLHVGEVRGAAKAGLMQFVTEDVAKKIVMAINNNEIANVTINY